MTNLEKLKLLNSYRQQKGLAPLADWRNARHQPMLDAFEIENKKEIVIVKVKKEKGPKDPTPVYKRMVHYKKSIVENPVQFVHTWLDENGSSLKRKAAVAALVEKGINFSTARTQYQRWFSSK